MLSRPSKEATSLLQMASLVIAGKGQFVPPYAGARKLSHLSDGYLVAALDALDAAVAALDAAARPSGRKQRKMLAALVAADMGGTAPEADAFTVGVRLTKQALRVRAPSIDGERLRRLRAREHAQGYEALTAALPALLEESEAFEAAEFRRLRKEHYVGFHELQLPETPELPETLGDP